MAKRRCLMAITGALHLGGGIATANRLALHAFLEFGYDVEVIALNESSDVASDLGTKIAYRGLANSKTAFAWAVWRSILRHHPSVIFCDHVPKCAYGDDVAGVHLLRELPHINQRFVEFIQ